MDTTDPPAARSPRPPRPPRPPSQAPVPPPGPGALSEAWPGLPDAVASAFAGGRPLDAIRLLFERGLAEHRPERRPAAAPGAVGRPVGGGGKAGGATLPPSPFPRGLPEAARRSFEALSAETVRRGSHLSPGEMPRTGQVDLVLVATVVVALLLIAWALA